MKLSRTFMTIAVLLTMMFGGACDQKQPPKTDAKPVQTAPKKADPNDWCKGHALPESMCTKCNPELTEKFKASGDWCAEHELPESACPKCNPMEPPGAKPKAHKHGAADPDDWCKGHALPESMCTKCNPELTEKFKNSGDWCAAHELPESACPKCNPMEPPGAKPKAHKHGAADPDDWCKGHALPESMCTKCNPELTEKFKSSGDWCAAHELPESACPKCNPMDPPGAKPKAHKHGAADPADWCKGHALPESMCTKCNPELTEKFKGSGDWCAAHELPESACPKCNPMEPPGAKPKSGHQHGAADPADWCKGHALPESMCTKCNPELTEKFKSSGDWCAAHELPESACPKCNPMEPPSGKTSAIEPGTVIRFKTASLEDSVGISTTPATNDRMDKGVEATAKIDFNLNATAEIRPALPGIVRDVRVDLGQTVKSGDPLFTLEGVGVADLQARRRSARERVKVAQTNLQRKQSLQNNAASSVRQVELARQELEAAEADFQASDRSLKLTGAPGTGGSGRYTVTSPIGGIVVRRPALVGLSANEASSLATITDNSTMWALLDIPEWDAASVAIGQAVNVRVDGLPGRELKGKVTWLSSEVSTRTRTVQARAELKNPDGMLRAGQFARATVQVAAPVGSVTVPLPAVQRLGEESVVFVRKNAGVYEPRVVKLGRSDGRTVQVEGELASGDAIVTTGAYLLRTELTRDSIGRGLL